MNTTVTIPFELQLTLRAQAPLPVPDQPTQNIFDELMAGAEFAAAEAAAPLPVCQLILPRKPGTHWPEQNGWYAGPVLNPIEGNWWHLIVPKQHLNALTEVEWGDDTTEIEGADSDYDGLSNTRAMCTAGNELAKRVRDLGEGVYLPSRAEALLLWSTLREVIGEGVAWTSTQYSARYAWFQAFSNGFQDWYRKSSQWRAVPVRRLVL